MEHRLDKINRFITEWAAYFSLADSPRAFEGIDHWTQPVAGSVRRRWCSGRLANVSAAGVNRDSAPVHRHRQRLLGEQGIPALQGIVDPLALSHYLRSATRTAGCGPACPVVGGRGRDNRPFYPITGPAQRCAVAVAYAAHRHKCREYRAISLVVPPIVQARALWVPPVPSEPAPQ
ncbi:group II intron maturase-specific domain-containing protein [Streptomyces brevispora]|uniref:group II intron maturase-specific domain-containing protein n=1 Tax=Streptomyces brevispora TaxID=887462 RepID=UPI0011A15522